MAQRIYVLADTVWRIICIIFLDMNEPSSDLIFYKLIVLRLLTLIGWLGWFFEMGNKLWRLLRRARSSKLPCTQIQTEFVFGLKSLLNIPAD